MYEYANVGVNNIRSYKHAYDCAGAGVNNICLYGRTPTRELASEGVNN